MASNAFDLGASIGSAVLGTGANIISTAMTNRANERMQQQQNAWNLEQWERNNAYNSPAAQMQRLKAAGINPDLMYGQNVGGASGNSAAPAQGTQPIPKQPFRVDPYLTAQLKLLASQTYKNNMDGKVSDIQAQNDEELMKIERWQKIGLNDAQQGYLLEMTRKEHELGDKIAQETENLKVEHERLKEAINTQVAQTDLLMQQGRKEEAAYWLLLAQEEGQQLNNEQQRIINQYLPQQQQAEIKLKHAKAYEAIKAGEEHAAGAALKTQQAETEKAKQKLIGQQTKTEEQKTGLMEYEKEKKAIEVKYEGAKQVVGMVTDGLSAVGDLIGGIKGFGGRSNKSDKSSSDNSSSRTTINYPNDNSSYDWISD